MSPSIVLIEDDPTMNALLQTLLRLEGYSVSSPNLLQDTGNLLAAIQSSEPDLIILDVNLRSISGFDLLQYIRQDATLSSCRVLMSSGMDVQARSLAAGADDFIMKPFSPDDLIKKIRMILELDTKIY